MGAATSAERGAAAPPPHAAPPPPPPGRGGPLRHAVRLAMYVMLVASAGLAALLGDRLWGGWHEGVLPVWAPLLAPVLFTAFVAVFCIDRWLLVRRHRYPASRALFQVALALVFLTLLLPQQAQEMRTPRPGLEAQPSAAAAAALLALLGHAEPEVRAAACVLVGTGAGSGVQARLWELAHNDPEATVRGRCGAALDRLHAAAAAAPAP